MTDETTRSDDIVVTPDAPQQHGAPGPVPKSEAQLSATATAFSAKAKDLRRVIPATPEGFWIGKEPSIRRRAGEVPLCLPPSTTTSHLAWRPPCRGMAGW